MAEGRSNAGIAKALWVTEGTVEKHVRSILSKLCLPETGDDHRRVLAIRKHRDSARAPRPVIRCHERRTHPLRRLTGEGVVVIPARRPTDGTQVAAVGEWAAVRLRC